MIGRGSIGLGLDAGGTATRWALADATGRLLARGEGPALSGHVFTPEADSRARAIAAALAAAILPHGQPAAALAGVTGTSQGTPQAARLAAILAEALGTPVPCITVTDDIGILHRARFAPGTGILVYAGTGSAACHITADGTDLHAGGLGALIDDAGGGYVIARDALRALLRTEEAAPGAGWATTLGAALAPLIGGTTWPDVRAYVYGGDRARMAALAPAVADAARRNDPTALAVLRQAGAELARLAQVLALRAGPQPIALAGGATRLHPLLADAMRDSLGQPVDVSDIDAAAAAARVAAGVSPLVSRIRSPPDF